jgi:Ser/Thr protein kinase RdoA (MazF antagonist)
MVSRGAERFVLQRVNPIFDPQIHLNLRAVTQRLRERGMATPTLVDSVGGEPWITLDDGGVWRLMTFVEGTGFDRVQSPAQAHAAGALLASFHQALADLPHAFVGRRLGVHDTRKHLASLARAVAQHDRHRLHPQVAELADDIAQVAAGLPPLPPLAERVCHGDPKLNNVLFAGPRPPASQRAICLIDLDTVGPMQLAHELGDAWRSWCNPAGEDDTAARFDMPTFAASWEGYASACAQPLDEAERHALLHSVEWISLELAARFAADALAESYFGWDPSRHAGRGEHNLTRARAQWGLHLATVESRAQRAHLLGLT